MKNDSKKAAIIGAVMSYLEEEAAISRQAQAMERPAEAFARTAQTSVNLWGLNGRQTQMQMRNLMGMKCFKRA